MTTHRRQLVLALGLLAAAGLARLPLEKQLTDDFRHRGLLRPPLALETQKKVGQAFWAVSLGGLRTLVATVLNLRAHAFFETQQWERLADAFRTITQLAPSTRYYWDTGSWHMAYNAASHYHYESDLPELRRRLLWRQWIEKGTDFLKEGIRQNPDDWRLWAALGHLLSDPNKLIDDEAAAAAYRQAVATGNAPPHIRRAEAYALARVPGKADAALPLVRRLLDEPGGRVPTLVSLRFALEARANPELDPHDLALQLFGNPHAAYDRLGNYFLDIRSRLPMDGVAPALRALEKELDVAADQSVFKAREHLLANPSDPWTS